jgi:hypothetical protein
MMGEYYARATLAFDALLRMEQHRAKDIVITVRTRLQEASIRQQQTRTADEKDQQKKHELFLQKLALRESWRKRREQEESSTLIKAITKLKFEFSSQHLTFFTEHCSRSIIDLSLSRQTNKSSNTTHSGSRDLFGTHNRSSRRFCEQDCCSLDQLITPTLVHISEPDLSETLEHLIGLSRSFFAYCCETWPGNDITAIDIKNCPRIRARAVINSRTIRVRREAAAIFIQRAMRVASSRRILHQLRHAREREMVAARAIVRWRQRFISRCRRMKWLRYSQAARKLQTALQWRVRMKVSQNRLVTIEDEKRNQNNTYSFELCNALRASASCFDVLKPYWGGKHDISTTWQAACAVQAWYRRHREHLCFMSILSAIQCLQSNWRIALSRSRWVRLLYIHKYI